MKYLPFLLASPPPTLTRQGRYKASREKAVFAAPLVSRGFPYAKKNRWDSAPPRRPQYFTTQKYTGATVGHPDARRMSLLPNVAAPLMGSRPPIRIP